MAKKMNISRKTVENQLSLALREVRQVIHLFVLMVYSMMQ
ncbi:MAG: hypothetical protein LUE93_07895 [Bacteroides sp.]|nr:hypothetical protein [Bacteroides sp.]